MATPRLFLLTLRSHGPFPETNVSVGVNGSSWLAAAAVNQSDVAQLRI